MSDRKRQKINRLNRIAGQVQGIARMVEEERYCIDLLNQLQAVRSALTRAESEILKDHVASCVTEAIASGDEDGQRKKFDELVDLLERRKR
ncbi:MAG: metal-sensitive transcriptional regulator [Sphingomonadaceae bacterium]|nr:metal-sensitive transcriptional regulator [Sphingomonadaceae bacterium]